MNLLYIITLFSLIPIFVLNRDEKEPLRPETRDQQLQDKGNTYVEFDGRKVYSKSGELIGKHSAV